MKQQTISQKRFSSGSTEIDLCEPPPSLSHLIAKTFLKNSQNKLLFASQTISMIKPIAISYLQEFPQRHEPFNCQLLLIDFSQLEIDYLQETLRKAALKEVRINYFEPDTAGALDIVRMNSQPIDKRKVQYMKPGLLSLSSQVFLTDLLRGWSQGNGLRIRIVLKMSDKVNSYYHYHAWLTTILKIKQGRQNDKASSVSIIYLCTTPHYYSEQNELVCIYRTFFCKQVVIWPFGRAEVHKALSSYRQKNSIKEFQHNLSFSDGERKLYDALMQLYNFLKKRQAGKNTRKSFGEYMLYSTPYEEGYQFTKGQSTQFQHVKLLLVYLESSSKLTMLNLITKFIEMKDCQIWNSNNREAIAIIENLLKQLQQSIFSYEKKEGSSNVLLIQLFSKLQGLDLEINFEKQYQFVCTYPLLLSLQFKPETNQKFTEIIKIIETIQPSRQQVDERVEEEGEDQASKRLFEELRKNQDESANHNVLILCGLKGVERFVKQNLEGYIADKLYLQYIRNLHRYLSATRYFRMRKIKKIYDRRKVKKGDNAQGSKKINDKHTWSEDNKQVLKQILFQELEKLNSLLLNFELSLGGINSGTEKDMNSQDTFQRNKDEAKIIESFNEEILTSDFKIIDISRIKVTSLLTSVQGYTFYTNGLKKKVLIDHETRSIEPNYFYQLLSNINPSTIIFYNPSPLLLRSLYLFQLQNPTQRLTNLHILSYENSYESKKASFEITKEDKAFWNISQNRSKLPQFIQSPFLRVKSINYRDSIELAKHRLNSKSLFRDQNEGGKSIGDILSGEEIRRKILVDTREFKSSLPSHLYHYGFQVIPVFLKTSDYVLSDDTAVEKKSVHTRDLHNSLKSFRLQEQLKRMCSKFKHPYLLIECEEQSDFIKSNFGYLDGTSGNKGRYELRKKLIQLLNKFPSVRLIWSSNVEQSCELIRQLKEDKLDPDLSKFIKQQNEDIPEEKNINLSRISQASQKKQQDEK